MTPRDDVVAQLIVQVTAMYERVGDKTRPFDPVSWTLDWLSSPIPALGGETPFAYLQKPDGVKTVKQLLAQLETGAFA